MLVETSTVKYCQTCPTGSLVVLRDTTVAGRSYSKNLYACQACPSKDMDMTYAGGAYACTCRAGFTQVGVASIGEQSCVYTDQYNIYRALEDTATQVKYNRSGTLVSQTLLHYFTKSAAGCAYYGSSRNAQDCQALANLCVLQLYDDLSGPCAVFNSIVTMRGTSYVNSVINWGTGMPWLAYDGQGEACKDTGYRSYVSLTRFMLKYVVAAYSMNGTFMGLQPLDTTLAYCTRRAPRTSDGAGSSSSTAWMKFGSTEQWKYGCDLDTLASQQQMFYELYVYDNFYPVAFYPVPVRIVGQIKGGAHRNSLSPRNFCDQQDALVRRFFLFDVASGVTTASTSLPQVMRYASNIVLEVQISSASFRRIFAPVLTIQYQENLPAAWTAFVAGVDEAPSFTGAQSVFTYFEARYTMNMDAFQTTLYGFFIAVVVFCGLAFLYRLQNWNVRQSRLMQAGLMSTGLNLRLLFEMIVLGTSSWVYFFFPVQVIICWYFFVFFKLQSVPATMLPAMNNIYQASNPYFVFVANLHVMAFFHLFYCLVMIYRQSHADIFFLDWQPAASTAKSNPKEQGRVSVWRTLFVANEWAELQTQRKTSVAFSLFWIGFFLIGLKQDYAATQQPDITNLQPGTLNIVLRFANTCWWWFVMSFSQWAWKFLFWERFVSETPEQQFIDFCTIAKVSILVLDEPYHGYYLHCRSPHQNADGTMAELVEMLHKEEAGLTIDRSLEGGPKDAQTFRIFMTAEWRVRFNKIYEGMAQPSAFWGLFSGGARGGGARGGALARMGGGDSSVNASLPDRVMTSWKQLSNFLQEFVENNLNSSGASPALNRFESFIIPKPFFFKCNHFLPHTPCIPPPSAPPPPTGLRRIIREGTYFERFAGAAPDMAASPDQPCIFLPDRNFEYCKMLFYGREMELLLMNVLAYSLFDLWFGSTAVSILLTYLLDFIFVFARNRMGTSNIASKTLIDSRFLFH